VKHSKVKKNDADFECALALKTNAENAQRTSGMSFHAISKSIAAVNVRLAMYVLKWHG
jgi:hypothetical protein